MARISILAQISLQISISIQIYAEYEPYQENNLIQHDQKEKKQQTIGLNLFYAKVQLRTSCVIRW